MWLRTGSIWTKCGFKTMLLPLFLSWFCNNLFVLWCMRATYEMLCYVESLRSWLVMVWFEIPRDFVDYRSYMGSSLIIWSLLRLFLDLCSYNLDGSVTMDMLEQVYGEVVTGERWTTWCIGGRCLLWPIKDCRGLMPRTRDYISVHTTGPVWAGPVLLS
jgi:hypothetical protein